MRWLGVTLAALTATLALAGWVYLRDRDTANWVPPTRPLARTDAAAVLTALDEEHCRAVCSFRLLGDPVPPRWRARLTIGRRTECVEIDLESFTLTARHSFTGLQPSPCVR